MVISDSWGKLDPFLLQIMNELYFLSLLILNRKVGAGIQNIGTAGTILLKNQV